MYREYEIKRDRRHLEEELQNLEYETAANEEREHDYTETERLAKRFESEVYVVVCRGGCDSLIQPLLMGLEKVSLRAR